VLDLTIKPEAERDIKDIWRYTRKTWSRPQADRYVATLRAAISDLADHPQRGRASSNIAFGLFRLVVERHVVFYRLSTTEVLVVRILHEKMDFAAHLANDET